jgi:transposase
MAKFKRYDYSQKVLIPVCLEEQLVPGSLEFAIHMLIETRMDMSVFEGKYKNDATGRSAYDPKILLKVVLLAYSRGLISSRDIERACCENVTFMALSGNQRPDHSTIATFVSSMKDQILPLFCGTFFALDGVKLPANASKESSGRVSDLKNKKDKIQQKVKRLLEDQIDADKDDDDDFGGPDRRQRQIDKLKKQADRIENWLKQNDAKISSNGKELKSNLTDNESAMMLTSHGTIQGYNGQALVDGKHQIIVHGEAFGSGQDAKHLEPMVDGAKDNLRKIGQSAGYFKGKIFTADTNYHNQSNLKKCHDEQLDAYIPDLKFRNRDPRFATRKTNKPKKGQKFVLADFKYNKASDCYICPNGKVLKLNVKRHTTDHNIYRRYMADENDCASCSLTHRCFYRKNTRRRSLDVPIGAEKSNFSKVMQNKVDSEKGRKIYPQRFAIVEPVFANIKTQKRLNRFTLRGKVKVNIQWMLYCMVHNIEKIMNFAMA